MSESESFLLNVFTKANLCEYFYKLIKNNKFKEKDEIAKLIGVRKELIKEVFEGLTFFELIEKKDNIFYPVNIDFSFEKLSADYNFKLYMLRKLREKAGDYPNWKKNAPNLLIIEYFLKNEIIIINKNDKIFVGKLNEYFRERKYNIMEMNTNKFQNWCKIFEYLGFIKRVNKSDLLFHIDYNLMISLIHIYSTQFNTEILYLKDFLNWISKNFFLIPIEGNKIPNLICKTFYSLMRKKIISFTKVGDRPLMELLDKPSLLKIPREVNAIKYLEMEV
ncbi:MAG: hypothetical protein ACTSRH_06890 [Promethearchaeota archaeon]